MVSVIEITKIALLVMVGRAEPFMARMIRHDAIVRKWWNRGDGCRVMGEYSLRSWCQGDGSLRSRWQGDRMTGERFP
jgi:hypothetical protein